MGAPGAGRRGHGPDQRSSAWLPRPEGRARGSSAASAAWKLTPLPGCPAPTDFIPSPGSEVLRLLGQARPPTCSNKQGGWGLGGLSQLPLSLRVPISGSLPQWTTPTAKASGGFFPSLSSLSPSLLLPLLLSLPPPPPFSLWITLPGTQRCLEVMNTVP